MASFPDNLRIQTLLVALSLMVRMAPLWFLPIIVSISKSPNLSFSSTISGRSSISTLPGINPRPAFLEPRLAYLRPCLRRYLCSLPPPPLILPNPAIYRFVRYHRNSLQAAPADNLLRAESFLQQLYYPFSHCRCKHFLAMFLLLAPVCFSLGKLHAIATTSGVAIALYLPVNSAFIYSDSFRYCFFAHRYLQHHRNCIPLFLGYMFAHLQLFFLWTDN